jgi:hypothetical protein
VGRCAIRAGTCCGRMPAVHFWYSTEADSPLGCADLSVRMFFLPAALQNLPSAKSAFGAKSAVPSSIVVSLSFGLRWRHPPAGIARIGPQAYSRRPEIPLAHREGKRAIRGSSPS